MPAGREVRLLIVGPDNLPLSKATVSLLHKDSTIIRSMPTDENGKVRFADLAAGQYFCSISYSGFSPLRSDLWDLTAPIMINETLRMQPVASVLSDVIVTSKKPFVQFLPDKTIINVEASINNAGSSVMDVLEKSPGITIGRDGTIIMKGKPQVMILIDGKQTQLTGTELQAYLTGINSSQVDIIELIDNPGAKYDAAGNAGIINIRTKKIRQRGFNGNLSLSLGQGFFPKTNNSLNMNYRNGKFNVYLNYGMRGSKERMQMEALRKYFDIDGNDSLLLQQPNITKQKIFAHNVKLGVDFFATSKTTLGVSFTGLLNTRDVNSFSAIDWMSPSYVIDSSINTQGTRHIEFKRAGININGIHTFNNSSELSGDIDIIGFVINGDQKFQTQLDMPGSVVQITRGNIPSSLDIITAKLDYSKRFKQVLWEAGFKTASTKTDNLAQSGPISLIAMEKNRNN